MNDRKLRFINLWVDWFRKQDILAARCYSFLPLNLCYIPRQKGGNNCGFIIVVIFNIGFEYRIGDWARAANGDIL